jgi:hypothetical protein
MKKHPQTLIDILAATLVLGLVSLACAKLNLPITQIKTGPTQTEEIQIPTPKESSSGVVLNLEFIAGDLNVSPGNTGNLVSGKATYNVADFKPVVEASGSPYSVRSGDLEMQGIPKVQGDLINKWDLQIANTPLSLNIKAGAYSGSFELGGLSLKNLSIEEGGSDVTCTFSEPNQVEMALFKYSTGASKANLKGLANANFEQMNFSSGAGDYTLSFDGDLQRDAKVKIDSGLGNLTIIVPEGINAQLILEGGLSTANIEGGWVQDGKVYTLSGNGPSLTITLSMGAGSLNLKTE